MNLKTVIKNNLEKMNYDLRDNGMYWRIFAGGMILLRELKLLLPIYCKGKILDAGAGRLLYKGILMKYSSDYESMDFQQTNSELTYVADIQNMPIIRSNKYDFI
ncbi:MAG: hypothetical protein WC523_07250, partial [Patescibacteria group bacterium]